ncbi:transposable element tcb2 transposase [Trichonephila clavipes]|nr:transposable element tcb2 transposase [Trichonephila clavipes]
MEPLIRLDMTLIYDRYISILSDHLYPFMSIVHSDELGEFQQDNATSHTSRIANEGIQDPLLKLDTSALPPKSPDMNIIVFIWDALPRAVEK